MKRALPVILVLAMLLSLSGCSDGPSMDLEDTTKYYNTYMAADPISMDISKISDVYSSDLVENVMEPLVRMGEVNGSYKILAGDAMTWSTNSDGTVWTFYLGDNTWSDGQSVTAHDYVYSLRRSADPATGCPNEYFLLPVAGYEEVRNGASVNKLGVKALDDKTLEITLSYPVPSFLEMICGTVYYPQRKDIVEQFGELYGTEPEYTVFNGPYTVENWDHDESIILKKREAYWKADKVSLENVRIHILEDAYEAYTMYENGELDYVSASDAQWVEKFQTREDTEHVKSFTASVNYIFYNTEDTLFSNANVRRAFTMAVNRADMNEKIYGGSSSPATGWVTAAMTVGSADYRAYAGDMIQAIYEEAQTSGMTARDYLLMGMEELGLGDEPAKLNITFSLAGSDERFRAIGDYFRNTYKESLGVELNISYQDWDAFYTDVTYGSYQMGYMSWEAYYNDPYDVLSLFLSTTNTLHSGWKNEAYDALVLAGQSEMDEEKRLELYRQAEEILLLEDYVVNPILFASVNSFYKNYVQGYATLAFSSGGYQGMTIDKQP